MKKTATAPSNIAFIKYWGRKNEALRLPVNGSISMNLSNLSTTTTVEFDRKYQTDDVVINGIRNEKETLRVIKHLDRIRKVTQTTIYAKVVSQNNFPSSTGLSSSASGFAALTVAGAAAAGLQLDEKSLSILARQGSGSACRSIPDGYVEWLDGDTSDTSYARSLFTSDHWNIADVVAIASREKKDVPTSEGQKRVGTSIFMEARLKNINHKIALCKKFMDDKNFTSFGELIEGEALELHAIMLTSQPSLIYWLPTTVLLMRLVKKWRNEGLGVYFTVNTGQDIHLICQKEDIPHVVAKLKNLPEVQKIIINFSTKGAHLIGKHLF